MKCKATLAIAFLALIGCGFNCTSPEAALQDEPSKQDSLKAATAMQEEALVAMKDGNFEIAEKLLKDSLKRYEPDGRPYLFLAEMYLKQGRRDDAYEALRQLYEPGAKHFGFGSSDHTPLLRYAQLCIEREKSAEAVRALKLITEREYSSMGDAMPDVSPLDSSLESQLAAALALCAHDKLMEADSIVDYSKADELLRESLRLNDDVNVKFYLGYALNRQKKTREAREVLMALKKDAQSSALQKAVDRELNYRVPSEN